MKYRQVRRFAVIISFLALIFLIYLTTFSSSYPCQDSPGKGCTNKAHDSKEEITDHTSNEVKMLIGEGQIVKRSNSDERPLKNSRTSQSSRTTKKDSKLSLTRGRKTPPKKVFTLSNEIRNFPVRSMYIQIKEADSPRIGDFPCKATVVPKCCAFSVSDTNEAKRICEAFDKFCKGFVMSTITSNGDAFEYIMYLKMHLNGTMANYLTDFYIKVDFLDELKWNDKR